MTPERWREITDVFHAALTHDAATREGFLHEACKHDPSLRAEVDALVAAHYEAGSFGERPLAIPEDVKRLEPGAQLGPFRIESLLGVGGMGEVYRATDTQLGRAVAIKVLPDSVARDPNRVARLAREARVLAALNHPHIATIYGIEEADDVRALVLELVDGKTLAHSFRGRRVPIGDALAIARQIAEALEAAHEKGIVHRDLKPANIAITRDGLVKVLDFGLAKAVDTADSDQVHTMESERTREGTIVGTAAYMSPEQARGLAVDKRTDIWAFGCVLYEILSGCQAFSGTTITDTLAAVIEREPDWSALPASTPPRIRRLLRRTLHKNPTLRLRDIGDARLELVAGEEAEPVAIGRSASRWVTASAIATVISIVGVGMFLLGRQREPVAEGMGANGNTPAFRQLTFRRGSISMARFAADGRNIVYSAAWDGRPHELYAGSLEGPESRLLDWPAGVLFAVSRTNEVAMSLGCQRDPIVASGCAEALATAPLTGGAPRALATDISFADWGPSGELAVVRTHGRIKRLEFPQGRVVHEAKELVFPRVSPQGRYIAVVSAEDPATAISGRGVVSILVVDRNGTKRTLATGWQLASGLAWSPSGNEVWFSGMQNGNVTLHAVTLDGQQRTVWRIPGTLRLHDIGPDGSVLFAMLTTRNVTMIKRPEQETEQPFSWFDEGWAVGLSPNGRLLLFNERGRAVGGKPTMYLRPTDGKSPPVRLGEGAALGLSRDARWVLAMQPVTGQQWQLAVIPTGPGDSIVLPRGAIESYNESYGSFSPDGRRVVFNGRRSGEGLRAFVQELPTGEPRPITPDLAYPGLGEISPDGRWVAESTNTPDGFRHALYPLGEGTPRPIPNVSPELSPMQWTLDGSEIFMRVWTPTTTSLSTDVFRVSPRTGARRFWRTIRVADPAGAGFPRGVMITPDGRTYVYNYVQMLQDLYVATGLK